MRHKALIIGGGISGLSAAYYLSKAGIPSTLLERQARKALFGAYRNPYTDDPSVAGKRRGAANTTPFFHGGRLLAFKEDSPPWEVDPVTLETVGEWTFGNRLRSQTVTAHPRLDPTTGEMHYFGYEATGLASTDVSYFVTNAKGELIREDMFQVPYCALMHDFVVTKEHVVFPGFPIVADLERMKRFFSIAKSRTWDSSRGFQWKRAN